MQVLELIGLIGISSWQKETVVYLKHQGCEVQIMRGYKDKNRGVNQRCEPRIGLIETRYRMDSMRLNMSAFGSVARQRKQREISCKTTTAVSWLLHWCYPLVCLSMLSDCADRVGGETALSNRDGEHIKVCGRQMAPTASTTFKTYNCAQGSAMILQGRYI
jgi:hypothetical protein